MEKKKILFICTHNSARSQIAEGLVNSLFHNKFEAYSAGIEIAEVRPEAVQVMKEIGIDISQHYSKLIKTFYGTQFDLVVTVCDNARMLCPVFPGAKNMIHKSFNDPSSVTGSEEEKLNVFRTVRDQIKTWLEEYLE